MGLPKPDMTIDPDRTALVITDLQNDFLTPRICSAACSPKRRW